MMTHSVLARARPELIKRGGATSVVVEDALPSAYYEALASQFPPLDFVAGGADLANNRAYRRTAAEAVADPAIPAIWKEFVDYHTSRAFFDELCDLLEQDILALHPDLEQNFGRPLREFRVGRRRSGKVDDPANLEHDLVLDGQIAVNSPVTAPSSVRGPHLDSPRKLFNALLYMRDPGDRSTGGDLAFYRLKEGRAPTRWSDIDADMVELTDLVPYGANTLVLFINGPAALHGVLPRSVTPLPRRYVNLLGECHGGASAAFFAPADAIQRSLWQRVKDSWRSG